MTTSGLDGKIVNAFSEPEDLEKVIWKKPEHIGSACEHMRQEAKRCIKNSDCVRVYHRSAKECNFERSDGSVPRECIAYMTALFDCKRSMIDNRARFRGRKGDNLENSRDI